MKSIHPLLLLHLKKIHFNTSLQSWIEPTVHLMQEKEPQTHIISQGFVVVRKKAESECDDPGHHMH